MNLDIDIIATSHGVIWRDNPMQIVSKYMEWCDDYRENQITVIYDTMWDGTKKVAEKIAEGIRMEDEDVTVKLFNIAKTDDNDLATEVFKSKAIAVGSPTVSNSVLRSLVGFIHYLKELKFKNKKAAAFGCYGWSGESPKVLADMLSDAGFEVVGENLKVNWNMTDIAEKEAIEFGKQFVRNI